MKAPLIRAPRLTLLLLLCSCLSACTNSAFVVRYAYNHADDHVISDLHGLATFTKGQRKSISRSVSHFQEWHRTTQLPKYADFLMQIAEALSSGEEIPLEELQNWRSTIDSYGDIAKRCLPLVHLEPAMLSLTEEQVDEINASISEKIRLADKRRGKHSMDALAEQRFVLIENWLSRVGVQPTPVQKRLIKRRLAQNRTSTVPYDELRIQWNVTLASTLRASIKSNDFEPLRQHLNNYWSLQREHNPATTASNAANFEAAALEFIASMSSEQKKSASRWLAKLSRSIRTVYKKQQVLAKNQLPKQDCSFQSL